ncbi:MAG: 30S ribosomal protein S6 [Candidatus Paceibacterota bacterium]
MKKAKKEQDIKKIGTEENMDNEQKRVYELGFLLNSNISEDKVVDKFSSIKKTLEKNECSLISEEWPKIKGLEYTMYKSFHGKKEKYDNAYFSWIKFEASPFSVDKINEEIIKDQDVIRFIIVKTVKENTLVITKKVSIGNNERRKQSVKREIGKEVSKEELDKTIDDLVIR